MTDQFFELYRKSSDAGQGTKDWAIKVTGPSEVTVKYGKTGSKLRTRVIKVDPPNSAQQEKFDRIAQKARDGYELFGKAEITDSGIVRMATDIERQTWSMSETDEEVFKEAIKSLVDDIVDYSFDPGLEYALLNCHYDDELKGAIIQCDGLLPTGGWSITQGSGLTYLTGDQVIGGGEIQYPLQLLLLQALSKRLPAGRITAVASKGQQERDLLPSKPGLPADFANALELPKDLVREVAQASNLIGRPIQILSSSAVGTPAAISF